MPRTCEGNDFYIEYQNMSEYIEFIALFSNAHPPPFATVAYLYSRCRCRHCCRHRRRAQGQKAIRGAEQYASEMIG